MQKSISMRVAKDMFSTQMIWASGYLFVMLIIFLVKTVGSFINDIEANNFIMKIIKSIANDREADSFSTLIFYSSNIFMFVIGIIAAYGFLQYFVSNGVTRKHYFVGAALGSFGVAIAIPIIIKLVLLVEAILLKILPVQFADSVKIVQPDNEIVGQIIQNILFSSYIDLNSSWLVGIVLFSINAFCYYVAGWLIGISFYHFGSVIGLVSIPVVIALLLIHAEIMNIAFDIQTMNLLVIHAMPIPIAYLLAISIIAIMLILIRLFTKKVVIKL
ncbi:hypothetical protein [Bacillus ndiopicus]|uniref:hypothetical protein n=1 Tax=Bacillus ndiopicus TaxID=1347368 RepID=UPI000AA39DF6|nr:hypothetical protein [Bacillus ndiopicus]